MQLKHLRLFRPSTIDWVLTKMMRGNDEQDMADAEFIIGHDRISKTQLLSAFSEMNPIDLPELRDALSESEADYPYVCAALTATGKVPVSCTHQIPPLSFIGS